jgi:peptidyl-prolyl cis-trans isomerase C
MKFKAFLLIATLVFVLNLPGISTAIAEETNTSKPNSVIAVVNGTEITARQLDVTLDAYTQELAMKTGRQVTEQELAQIKPTLMEELINQELMYQAALKQKTAINEEEYQARWSQVEKQAASDARFSEEIKKTGYSMDEIKQQIRRQFLINQFAREKFLDPVAITEAEIRGFYEAHKKDFIRPEQVRAQHILIKPAAPDDVNSKATALKKIQDIKKKLDETKDFDALAMEYSQCPSSKKGGDLGFFGRGEMTPPFEEAAFALGVNDISDIVETQFGYHILKVTGKTAETSVSFEEVKADIEATLVREKAEKAMGAFLDSEKKTGKIELLLNESTQPGN